MSEAWRQLLEQCAACDSFLVEFSDLELFRRIESFGPRLLSRAVVIHLTAPIALRLERNKSRGERRMPSDVVERFRPLCQAELDELERRGVVVHSQECVGGVEFDSASLVNITISLINQIQAQGRSRPT